MTFASASQIMIFTPILTALILGTLIVALVGTVTALLIHSSKVKKNAVKKSEKTVLKNDKDQKEVKTLTQENDKKAKKTKKLAQSDDKIIKKTNDATKDIAKKNIKKDESAVSDADFKQSSKNKYVYEIKFISDDSSDKYILSRKTNNLEGIVKSLAQDTDIAMRKIYCDEKIKEVSVRIKYLDENGNTKSIANKFDIQGSKDSRITDKVAEFIDSAKKEMQGTKKQEEETL